jgi:hypothetical protein
LYLFVSVLEDKEPEIVCQFVVGDIVAVSWDEVLPEQVVDKPEGNVVVVTVVVAVVVVVVVITPPLQVTLTVLDVAWVSVPSTLSIFA